MEDGSLLDQALVILRSSISIGNSCCHDLVVMLHRHDVGRRDHSRDLRFPEKVGQQCIPDGRCIMSSKQIKLNSPCHSCLSESHGMPEPKRQSTKYKVLEVYKGTQIKAVGASGREGDQLLVVE